MRIATPQSTITARFRPPILAAIEAIADREQVSRAEVMRRAVEHFVLKHGQGTPMELPVLLSEASPAPAAPPAPAPVALHEETNPQARPVVLTEA